MLGPNPRATGSVWCGKARRGCGKWRRAMAPRPLGEGVITGAARVRRCTSTARPAVGDISRNVCQDLASGFNFSGAGAWFVPEHFDHASMRCDANLGGDDDVVSLWAAVHACTTHITVTNSPSPAPVTLRHASVTPCMHSLVTGAMPVPTCRSDALVCCLPVSWHRPRSSRVLLERLLKFGAALLVVGRPTLSRPW